MSSRKLVPGLRPHLEAYRKQRAFDADKWITDKCGKLNAYMAKHGLKACVTSISGGLDSAVILGLCAKAAKMEHSPIQANVGVCQPIHSSDWALQRGLENIRAFNATEVVVDQTDVYDLLGKKVDEACRINGNHFARGQLRSYMRTPVGYYVAQLYSQSGKPAIVMGTGNLDEDGFLAYFCKAGDGVVDVQLISDIHKSEVFTVAEHLGVPKGTRTAAPSADLWAGQTDEDELGFPYDFVELYTGTFRAWPDAKKQEFLKSLDDEAKKQFQEYAEAAETVHRRNRHKIVGVQNL